MEIHCDKFQIIPKETVGELHTQETATGRTDLRTYLYGTNHLGLSVF